MYVCEQCKQVVVDRDGHEHAVTPLAVTRSIDPGEQPTPEELFGVDDVVERYAGDSEIPRQRGVEVDADD